MSSVENVYIAVNYVYYVLPFVFRFMRIDINKYIKYIDIYVYT